MRLAYIPFLLSLLLLFSCEGERVSTFSITSYNLYLLFDGTDDGDEFPPLSSSEGDGDEEYLGRMDIYSSVFNDDEFLSDVLVFQEIESEEMGTIREVCLEDATPVEYGTVLFYIEPIMSGGSDVQ